MQTDLALATQASLWQGGPCERRQTAAAPSQPAADASAIQMPCSAASCALPVLSFAAISSELSAGRSSTLPPAVMVAGGACKTLLAALGASSVEGDRGRGPHSAGTSGCSRLRVRAS